MTASLREAVTYQYIYLTAQGHDEERLRTVVDQAIRHVYRWLGDTLPPGEPAIHWPQQPQRRRVERIYPPPDRPQKWVFHGRLAAYADVRLSDDTLTLQLACGCREEADEEARRCLAHAPWTPPDDPALVPGQTLCFGGRLADLAAAQAEAERVLPATAGQVWPLRRVDLALGRGRSGWLFDRPGLPDRLAFFYPDEDEAEQAASAFFTTILPDLALAWHKIAHQYGRGYERALQKLLADKEDKLAQVLAAGAPQAAAADALDDYLKELAGAFNAFADDLARFQRLSQAVRVNLLNLQACFSEHSLPQEGPLAVRLTAAQRAREQLEADDGFYRARVQQAEMALAALQVQAGIERNRIEQEETRQAERRNLLLGFMGRVLALGKVMSDPVVLAFQRWLLARFDLAHVEPVAVGTCFGVKLALV